jgi:hypothetical protein
MSGTADDDEWLRPVDLMVDSYAPEEIADELGRRHGLYVREAHRLVVEGLVPNADALRAGITAETARYLYGRPWFAHPGLAPAVAEAESRAQAALAAIATSASPPPPAEGRPVRRLALQSSATIVGTMAVRKQQVDGGLELSWDTAPAIVEWRLRLARRPDPRRPYVDDDSETLRAGTTSFVIALDEVPRRVQITGRARDGRVMRRAVISGLTRENGGAQWKRQSTAS